MAYAGGVTVQAAITDTALRACGFAIHARPANSPAVWIRHGKTFLEPVAVKIARRELANREQANFGDR